MNEHKSRFSIGKYFYILRCYSQRMARNIVTTPDILMPQNTLVLLRMEGWIKEHQESITAIIAPLYPTQKSVRKLLYTKDI